MSDSEATPVPIAGAAPALPTAGQRLRHIAVRAGQWLVPLSRNALTGLGFLALAWVIYANFIRSRPAPVVNPEVLADHWSETIAQFGISPVFPPREDVQIGDVYAVLGDVRGASPKDVERVKLKFPRAVKLGHAEGAEAGLREEYKNVIVFPDLPVDGAAPPKGIHQVPCEGECFKEAALARLPLVIFPGTNSAHAQQAAAQGNWLDSFGRFVAGTATDESGSVAISVPYAETFGLPAIKASKLLDAFCNKHSCDQDTVRGFLTAVVGKDATSREVQTNLYDWPVYVVLVRSLYVTRAINYSFTADSATATKVRVYKDIEKRLKEDNVTTSTAPSVAPSGDATSPDSIAMQRRALEDARKHVLDILGDGTSGSGGSIDIGASSSDRVVIDRVLPRPVVIGIAPVIRHFFSSNLDLSEKVIQRVVEPEP